MLAVKIFTFHVHRIKLFILRYVKAYRSDQNDLKMIKIFFFSHNQIIYQFQKVRVKYLILKLFEAPSKNQMVAPSLELQLNITKCLSHNVRNIRINLYIIT